MATTGSPSSRPRTRRLAILATSFALLSAAVVAALLASNAPDLRVGWSAGVDSWVTDLATNQRLARDSRIPWQDGPGGVGSSIVVDPTRRYQQMVGFGASMTDSSAYVLSRLAPSVSRKIMQELFSPTDGIEISMLRQPMGASDFAVGRAYSYDDQPAGETDPNLSDFSIRHDEAYLLPRLREAYALNPQLTFMASPWSAPGWMKDSDSLITGSLLPRYHQAYANYFVRFIKSYQQAGIPTDYVSMQNEPLHEPADYPGMGVLPDQAALFLGRYLGPTLTREGLHDTQILGYDHNWDVADYPGVMYADPQANRYVAGSAWHCYRGEVVAQSVAHNDYPHAQAFQTECSGGGWQGAKEEAFDLTMASIIGVPRNWGQSVVFWNLVLDSDHGPTIGGCDDCRGVVTVDTQNGTVTKEMEYWALAHATKFLPPGSVRIGSSVHPTAAKPNAADRGLTNVAFTAGDGAQVMIAHNATDVAQTFDVEVGDRYFTATLASGAAATYRWQAPAIASAAGLGWVDLDFGAGPPGTPTGRLIASVGPEVAGALSQVKLGNQWLGYSLPYGSQLRPAGAVPILPRTGWKLFATGVTPVENQPLTNALDGDRGTRWSSGAGRSARMSLTVDLARPTTFSEIVLDTLKSPADYLRRYSVQVSTDGKTWTEIARGNGKPSASGIMTIVLPRTTARQLRIANHVPPGISWSLHELSLRSVPNAVMKPPSRDLVSERAELPDGTQIVGHHNPRETAAVVVPWPLPGLNYTYRLAPQAAATFALPGAEPADRIGPAEGGTPGG